MKKYHNDVLVHIPRYNKRNSHEPSYQGRYLASFCKSSELILVCWGAKKSGFIKKPTAGPGAFHSTPPTPPAFFLGVERKIRNDCLFSVDIKKVSFSP